MLNHGQRPLNPMTILSHSRVPAAVMYMQDMLQFIDRAKNCRSRAQQQQKAYADKGRQDASYQLGDKLLLNTEHVRLSSYLDGLVLTLFLRQLAR